ncbi:MAG: UDP-N-acetylmuramoyl-L-alanine--D-glutamate ligase [Flavobacteriales bacterium]|nr:UDP-N-acetylmuramoyl-L-alanine--D-glutamate ligase [Flavobacteriales bacterium]
MKKLVVLGAGESGVGAALLAQQKGWEVWVSDAGKVKEEYKNVLSHHGISLEEEGHSEEVVLQADEVVKSPGIPDHVPLVKKLVEKGIPVIGELEFAGRYTKAKCIGITGSNGKTTTTMLIHHILKRAGLNVGMAGNVGDSFAKVVAEGDPYEWMVLEISSFQLDGMFEFKCDIAILLNITEDHLDRYEYDLMKYARSKMRITQNQKADDWFIYNMDDPVTAEVMKTISSEARKAAFSLNETKGTVAHINDNQIIINPPDANRDINPITMTIQELALQGKHNLYNSMASGIAARIMEVRKDIIRECLTDFQNVEHRLELVNEVYGISFINDSKATNVNSTWYALESMSAPVVWIVGGVDKGNDYEQLKEMVTKKVKAIVCLGKDNKKLHEAFGDLVENIVDTDNMRDAVLAAYKSGLKGDAVLLSPACASFDLFEDYEDRGRQFKESVRNL